MLVYTEGKTSLYSLSILKCTPLEEKNKLIAEMEQGLNPLSKEEMFYHLF